MAFDPTSISGCTLDVDPGVLLGVISNGGSVENITDKVQSLLFQHHAGWTTRPLFREALAALGDQPALDWAQGGTWAGMRAAAACQTVNSEWTIVSVYVITSGNNDDGTFHIGRTNDDGSANGYSCSHRDSGGLKYRALFPGQGNIAFGNVPGLDEGIIQLISRESGVVRGWGNGHLGGTTGTNLPNAPTLATWIGCSGSVTNRLRGYLGRVIAFDRAISTSERDQLLVGLADQYLLTVRLSNGSDYTGALKPATPVIFVDQLSLSGGRMTISEYSHSSSLSQQEREVWVERTSDNSVVYGPVSLGVGINEHDVPDNSLIPETEYRWSARDQDEDDNWSDAGSVIESTLEFPKPDTPTVESIELIGTRVRATFSEYSHPLDVSQDSREVVLYDDVDVILAQAILSEGTLVWESPNVVPIGATDLRIEIRDYDVTEAVSSWGSAIFSTFVPTDLEPYHWNRAQNVSSSDGTEVDWPDVRGFATHGRWWTHSSDPRPKWYSNILNGRAIFRWDRSAGTVGSSFANGGAWNTYYDEDFTIAVLHRTNGECVLFSELVPPTLTTFTALRVTGDPGKVGVLNFSTGNPENWQESDPFHVGREVWQLLIVRRTGSTVEFFEGLAKRGEVALSARFAFGRPFGRAIWNNSGKADGDIAEVFGINESLSMEDLNNYISYIEDYYGLEVPRADAPEVPGPALVQYLGSGQVLVSSFADYSHLDDVEQLGRRFRLRDGDDVIVEILLAPGSTSHIFEDISDPVGLIAGVRDEAVNGGRSAWAETDPIPEAPAPPYPISVEHQTGSTWRIKAGTYAHPLDSTQDARYWRIRRDDNEAVLFGPHGTSPGIAQHDAVLSAVSADTMLRWGAADKDEDEILGPYAEIVAPLLAGPIVDVSGIFSRSVTLHAIGSAVHQTQIRYQIRRSTETWNSAFYDLLEEVPGTGSRQQVATTLLPGQSYVYRARQEYGGLKGPWSPEVPVVTLAETAQPGLLVRITSGLVWHSLQNVLGYFEFSRSGPFRYGWLEESFYYGMVPAGAQWMWGWDSTRNIAFWNRNSGGYFYGPSDPALTQQGWLRPFLPKGLKGVHQIQALIHGFGHHSIPGNEATRRQFLRLRGNEYRSGYIGSSTPAGLYDLKLDEGSGLYWASSFDFGGAPIPAVAAEEVDEGEDLIEVVGSQGGRLWVRSYVRCTANTLTVRGVPAGLAVRIPTLYHLHALPLTIGTEVQIPSPPLEVVSEGGEMVIDLGTYRFPIPHIEIREPSSGGEPGTLLAEWEWEEGEIPIYGGDVWHYKYTGEFPLPPIALGGQCSLLLQVYEEDKLTVAWEVSTNQDHENPFLSLPENYAEQEIDITAGAATIGQVEVIVIDRHQAPGDQDSGFITEKLSEHGITAIYGRRCRLLRFINEELGYVVIADGPAGPPAMHSSYAAYQWMIRDTRETERKFGAFARADTNTLLPMGVRDGFGWNPEGETWLVPPTEPLIGLWTLPEPNFGLGIGSISFASYWPDGSPTPGPKVVPWNIVVNRAVEELFNSTSSRGEFNINSFNYPNIEILWRVAGSGAEYHAIEPSRFFIGDPADWNWPLASLFDAELDDGTPVRAALAINMISIAPMLSGISIPENNTQLEIIVRYSGTPSRNIPYHLEGITAGELLKRLYDGVYSPPDPFTGLPVPTGIRYDQQALLQITDPIRMRITEPVKDIRDWTEKHIYSVLGWVPALDNDGRISPVSQVPPQSFENLMLIDDDITEPGPNWNAGERIVNLLVFKYPRFFLSDVAESVDRILERSIEIRYNDPFSAHLHGEQDAEYNGMAFGALGDELGGKVEEVELGAALAELRRLYVFERFKNGAQSFRITVFRNEIPLMRAGDWATFALSWLPDYVTRRRGLITGGQVIAIKDLDCAKRELLVEEAFPVTVPGVS